MSALILPPDSALYATFAELVADADLVFLAGLPGVGKSLLLQQLALMAEGTGRRMHLLQWDVARQPFETPTYPLQDGATHPMVIQATGLWLRRALVEWQANARKSDDILIGEAPLIGGRLMEIVRPVHDDAEALLSDPRTQFVIPVPSKDVRALIESKREQSIADPQHENEAHDAPPDLLRALWGDLYRVAAQLGLAKSTGENAAYSPEVYAAVYLHLLQHRHVRVLRLDEPLSPTASVYNYTTELPALSASKDEAQAIMTQLEATMSQEQVQAAAERWFEL